MLVNQPSCSGRNLAFFDLRQQCLCVDGLSNCCDIFGGLLGTSEELLHAGGLGLRCGRWLPFSETEALLVSWVLEQGLGRVSSSPLGVQIVFQTRQGT